MNKAREHKKSTHLPICENGSNLIGVSLMIITLGFLITGGVFLLKNYWNVHAEQTNVDNLRHLQQAISEFVNKEGRFPCPASLSAGLDTNNFGVEKCASGGGVSSTSGRGGLSILIGTVPVRSLNIQDNNIIDGYNKRYIYAVTKDLATDGTDVRNDPGAIYIHNQHGDPVSDVDGFVKYTLISLGQDDRGAYNINGVELAPCDSSTDAGENCDNDNLFISSTEKNYGDNSNSFTHSFAFEASSPSYKWYMKPWTACAGVCFAGTQSRGVLCRDHHNQNVSDSFCNHTPKSMTSRECALPPCYWDIGTWRACTMGTGL